MSKKRMRPWRPDAVSAGQEVGYPALKWFFPTGNGWPASVEGEHQSPGDFITAFNAAEDSSFGACSGNQDNQSGNVTSTATIRPPDVFRRRANRRIDSIEIMSTEVAAWQTRVTTLTQKSTGNLQPKMPASSSNVFIRQFHHDVTLGFSLNLKPVSGRDTAVRAVRAVERPIRATELRVTNKTKPLSG